MEISLPFLVLLASPSIISYAEEKFNVLDDQLKLFQYNQGDNNVFQNSADEDLSSPVDQTIVNEFASDIRERFDQSPDTFFEELLSDGYLPNSSQVDVSEGIRLGYFYYFSPALDF